MGIRIPKSGTKRIIPKDDYDDYVEYDKEPIEDIKDTIGVKLKKGR